MTDKPITIPAIRIPALREGRMTQMRVPLKEQPISPLNHSIARLAKYGAIFQNEDVTDFRVVPLPYSIGDWLWCRETWRPSRSAADPWHIAVLYPGDGHVKHWDWSSDADFGDWLMPKQAVTQNLSPVTMPRWASRTTLVVNDVRVQRVQEISSRDVLAEGVEQDRDMLMAISPSQSDLSQRECFHRAHTQPFRTIWNTLHGPDAWDRNDWVCAISFDVHRCNIDQMPSIGGRD